MEANATVTECTSCGKKYKLSAQMLGKKAKCKQCGTVFVVEEPKKETPAKVEAAVTDSEEKKTNNKIMAGGINIAAMKKLVKDEPASPSEQTSEVTATSTPKTEEKPNSKIMAGGIDVSKMKQLLQDETGVKHVEAPIQKEEPEKPRSEETAAVACASCGKKYKFKKEFEGKKAKCKQCGTVFVVRLGQAEVGQPEVKIEEKPKVEEPPAQEEKPAVEGEKVTEAPQTNIAPPQETVVKEEEPSIAKKEEPVVETKVETPPVVQQPQSDELPADILEEEKITVACTSCSKKYRVRSEYAGKKVKCKGCGAPFVMTAIPGRSEARIQTVKAQETPKVEEAPKVEEEPVKTETQPVAEEKPIEEETAPTDIQNAVPANPQKADLVETQLFQAEPLRAEYEKSVEGEEEPDSDHVVIPPAETEKMEQPVAQKEEVVQEEPVVESQPQVEESPAEKTEEPVVTEQPQTEFPSDEEAGATEQMPGVQEGVAAGGDGVPADEEVSQKEVPVSDAVPEEEEAPKPKKPLPKPQPVPAKKGGALKWIVAAVIIVLIIGGVVAAIMLLGGSGAPTDALSTMEMIPLPKEGGGDKKPGFMYSYMNWEKLASDPEFKDNLSAEDIGKFGLKPEQVKGLSVYNSFGGPREFDMIIICDGIFDAAAIETKVKADGGEVKDASGKKIFKTGTAFSAVADKKFLISRSEELLIEILTYSKGKGTSIKDYNGLDKLLKKVSGKDIFTVTVSGGTKNEMGVIAATVNADKTADFTAAIQCASEEEAKKTAEEMKKDLEGKEGETIEVKVEGNIVVGKGKTKDVPGKKKSRNEGN